MGYNFAIADFAAHEYVGIVRYYVYNLLGLEPIWDSFWIPLNFSLFSPRDHRVGTMRVVFLAWTPGKRWPDRAYPEDLGRGGSSGSAGGAGEPVKSRRSLWLGEGSPPRSPPSAALRFFRSQVVERAARRNRRPRYSAVPMPFHAAIACARGSSET